MGTGAGKGDRYRPVDRAKWDEGWERVFGKPKVVGVDLAAGKDSVTVQVCVVCGKAACKGHWRRDKNDIHQIVDIIKGKP